LPSTAKSDLLHIKKVVTKNMKGEPILPTDEELAGVEEP